jgi:acid phosphatase type 7
MHFVLNGQAREFPQLAPGANLQDLIADLGLKGDRIAIEHNGTIIPRTEWATAGLAEGDRLEIVHFVGGGRPDRFFCAATFLVAIVCITFAALQSRAQTPDDVGGPTFTVSDLPVGRPLRIIVYGDMRFTETSNTSDTRPGVRKWLAEKVGEEKPDILLLTGDMPFHGSNPADWKIYEQETASWAQVPMHIYPTIGNHEGLPDPVRGIQNYFAAYPQIERHDYYSVRLGNIYLITLDSSTFLSAGWQQRLWLETQLAHIPPEVNFVFLLLHVPVVTDLQTAFMLSVPDPYTLELRHQLETAAARSRAKFVVFNGHIHNYERFEVNGITHVISGGGGARPYPIFIRCDQDLYRAGTYPNFNYVVITLEGKHADAKMYRVVDPDAANKTVELKDSFTLDAK